MSAPSRNLPDWISSFIEYTDDLPSPPILRLWSGITAIAGALERRVWVNTAGKSLFPNLYTLLVAPPAVGKTNAIEPTEQLWMDTKKLHVSPNSLTSASLVDALAKASRRVILNESTMVDYHSLQIAASEFGILVPAHDTDFLSKLNHIYDCPKFHRELRRTRKEEDDISKPQLNILAGTQPAYLADLLPEQAWGMGFMSRVIMIYSNQKTSVNLFSSPILNTSLYAQLLSDMKAMLNLYGEIRFNPAIHSNVQDLVNAGLPPVPEHSKLVHYSGRRILSFLKLCMISSISSRKPQIEMEDVERAHGWLTHAEEFMPDIFKEMVHRSDAQLIQELHYFAWKLWVQDRKPIHETRLIHYLSAKVPSDKIGKILEIAVRSNIFERMAATDLYKPMAKTEHGVG